MPKYMSVESGTGRILLLDLPGAVAGDISSTIFNAANNQAIPADITDLLFNISTVTSARIILTAELIATANKYETFDITVMEKDGSWVLNETSIGDASGVAFSITNAGQVQYTSGTYAGFSSLKFGFRAIVTLNS